MSQVIELPEGSIELIDAPLEWLRPLRTKLPLGLMLMKRPGDERPSGGIVMKCGETEVYGVKFQPPDVAAAEGRGLFMMNRAVILMALVDFAASGFEGVLIPVSYMRQKENGQAEAGIAVFAFPSMADKDRPSVEAFTDSDEHLAPGAMMYVMEFMKRVAAASKEFSGRPYPLIGVDVRPRLALGSIMFDFLSSGPDLLCLKSDVNALDPLWTLLHKMGGRKYFHMPMYPIDIPPEELPRAQGKLSVN